MPRYLTGHIPLIPCACGCGERILALDSRNQPRSHVPSHAGRAAAGIDKVNWGERTVQWNLLAPLCACGCGGRLERSESQIRNRTPDPKYLVGHHRRRACVESLTTVEKSIIYGSLLGDMCITRPKDNATPRLTFTHGQVQTEYAFHKTQALHRLGWWFQENVPSGGFGNLSVQGSSSCMPVLEDVWQIVRSSGPKKIIPVWLEQVDERGLAYWFMDDGSTSRNVRGITHVAFHTEGFAKEENQVLCDWLGERFGIQCRVSVSKGYFYLYVPRKEALKLLHIVAPYLHKSMTYKGL